FGQSNAANSLERRYSAPKAVNFHDGKCYPAQDPLLGTTNQYGSVWTLLASKLDVPVVIIAAGVGGSSVKRWASGDLHDDMQRTLRGTKYRVTHFLWHQGETDATDGTTADEYAAALRSVI